MKNILILSLLLNLLFSCSSSVNQNNFQDSNHIFSVNFIEEPVKAVDTFDTEIGKIVLHTFMLEESATLAKTVTYSDYPQNVVDKSDPYDILNSAKQGAIKSLGINQIEKDEKINENGVPGYELIGSNELDFHIHYKLLLKENRLFQIGVLNEGSLDENQKEQDFIESFVLLD